MLKAHGLLYQSTLGSRVIKNNRKDHNWLGVDIWMVDFWRGVDICAGQVKGHSGVDCPMVVAHVTGLIPITYIVGNTCYIL